jgi:hypothetical protein
MPEWDSSRCGKSSRFEKATSRGENFFQNRWTHLQTFWKNTNELEGHAFTRAVEAAPKGATALPKAGAKRQYCLVFVVASISGSLN